MDDPRRGRAWCRARSDEVDAWVRDLFAAAAAGDGSGIALVAVGGYGRAELFPGSDLDLVLLHEPKRDVSAVAERLWYPIWDAGLKLGHSVRTVDQALALARQDLDTATALLSTRHLAGDGDLATALAAGARRQWERGAKRWLSELAERVAARHARAGEVAFLLEPDLKEGRGGLRDVHALEWAVATKRLLFEPDQVALDSAYAVIADARVELQRRTRSTSNRLALQDQDAVAAALDYADADALMHAVSSAARTIAWASDDLWRRIGSSLRGPIGRTVRRDRVVRPGIVLRDGEVLVEPGPRADDGGATLVLQAAAAAAKEGAPFARPSLDALGAAAAKPVPDPWPAVARDALVELLLAGRAAIGVIETLDQIGVWLRLLPEWAHVRSRPQRNAYHRFTVDRHLVETAANAAALAGRVDRPDLLAVGSLLHDIGKGLPGDHTEAGMRIVRVLGTRMGFAPGDVDTLVALVEHHLLLADIATRRDLDDPGTIERVVGAVGSIPRLRLLAALTEADSIATGPSAWSPWKALLVRDLVERAEHVVRGGAATEVSRAHELTPAQRALLDRGQVQVDGRDGSLTVVARDEPGLMARLTGVLTLHGIRVLAATAHSDERGWILDEFVVESAFGDLVDWAAVARDIDRVLADPGAFDAAVERKIGTYDGRAPQAASTEISVEFDTGISAHATVVEVHAPDRIGLLYRITRALGAAGLDIRSAKVQTMGPHAVDAFYVRDRAGAKVVDPAALAAIEREVLRAVRR